MSTDHGGQWRTTSVADPPGSAPRSVYVWLQLYCVERYLSISVVLLCFILILFKIPSSIGQYCPADMDFPWTSDGICVLPTLWRGRLVPWPKDTASLTSHLSCPDDTVFWAIDLSCPDDTLFFVRHLSCPDDTVSLAKHFRWPENLIDQIISWTRAHYFIGYRIFRPIFQLGYCTYGKLARPPLRMEQCPSWTTLQQFVEWLHLTTPSA